jgi:hypothetical protein
VPANVDYYFVNGVPSQVRMWALPIHTTNKLSAEMGLYAQDSWTVKRRHHQRGLRFDYFKNSFPSSTSARAVRAEPEHHLRAGQLLQHEGSDAARRHCLRPVRHRQDRAEGALGQVRPGLSAGTGNPVGNLSTNATRTWTDNGNFQWTAI